MVDHVDQAAEVGVIALQGHVLDRVRQARVVGAKVDGQELGPGGVGVGERGALGEELGQQVDGLFRIVTYIGPNVDFFLARCDQKRTRPLTLISQRWRDRARLYQRIHG